MISTTTPAAGALVPVRRRPADQHPVATYLAGLGPGSRRTMRAALQNIAHQLSRGQADLETFPWEQLRHQHVQAVRQLLIDSGRAPATVNRHLAALRGVLRSAWRLGLMSDGDYLRAIDVKAVPGSRLPRGRALEPAELDALLASCRQDLASKFEWNRYRGGRDVALIAVLYGAGLRRDEAARLQLEDLRGEALRVLGKGNKERLVPLGEQPLRALGAWLDLRGLDPGPLLTRISDERKLSTNAIYMALRRRAAAAGVAEFAPHDLRRSYGTGLLDAGVDLNLVRQLMGHSQVQTTARYDRRQAASLARAAEQLRFSF